jgi:hypothetical protein
MLGGILLVGAGVGVVCASGIAVSTALNWFHTFEMDFEGRKKEKRVERSHRASNRSLPNNRFSHLADHIRSEK